MKKRLKENVMLIIIGLIILIPITYYFMYALPQHNRVLQQIERDKLEYQREQDRLEQERLQQEKEERERKEFEEQERIRREKEEKERAYNNCIDIANKWREDNFELYCELGYKTCLDKNGYDCNKYKMDSEGTCNMLNNYAEERKEGYERQLKMCDRYL